jgi:hypothetical protein
MERLMPALFAGAARGRHKGIGIEGVARALVCVVPPDRREGRITKKLDEQMIVAVFEYLAVNAS